MPTATVTNTFSAHTNAAAAQVNKNFQDLLDFLNTTKLDKDNLQSSVLSLLVMSASGAFDLKSQTSTITSIASETDIPGLSATLAPTVTSTALVIGIVGFGTLAESAQAFLQVDGSDQTFKPRVSEEGGGQYRQILGFWKVPLAAGSHTLKLRTQTQGTSGSTCTDSLLAYLMFAA